MTLRHEERLDIPAVAAALQRDARYIGAIGAKRTQERRRAALAEQGFSDAELDGSTARPGSTSAAARRHRSRSRSRPRSSGHLRRRERAARLSAASPRRAGAASGGAGVSVTVTVGVLPPRRR